MTKVTRRTFDRHFNKLLADLNKNENKVEIYQLMEQQVIDDTYQLHN